MKKWMLRIAGTFLATMLITGCNLNDDDQNPPPEDVNDGILEDNNGDNDNGVNDNNGNGDLDLPGNDNNNNDGDLDMPGNDNNNNMGDDENDNIRDPEDIIEDPEDLGDNNNKDE